MSAVRPLPRDDAPSQDAAGWPVRNLALLDLEVERVRLLLALHLEARRRPLRDESAESHAPTFRTRLVAVEAEIAAARSDFKRHAETDALTWLAELFGLTAFEQQALTLCLAVELELAVEGLIAAVQEDTGQCLPTPSLALALFAPEGEERLEALASFGEGGTLRRLRLLALEPTGTGGLVTRPMRLEERVRDAVLGVGRIDPRAEACLKPVPQLPLAPCHRALVQTAQARLGRGGARALELIGKPRCGRRAVARAVAGTRGLTLVEIEPARLPPSLPERHEMLAVLAREAALARLAFYLERTRPDPGDAGLARTIEDIALRLEAYVLIGATEPWPGPLPLPALRIPEPDAATRKALWLEALAPETVDPAAIEALVQQFRIGPAEIARVAAAVHAEPVALTSAADRGARLWQLARASAAADLAGLAQKLEPRAEWDDLVVPADVTAQLQELAGQVAARAKVHEAWGFGAKLGRGRGVSVLLAGPSGVGKTMAAEVLARHLDLDLYRIDLAGVVSKWIGETEKNLKRIFEAAEASGAVLFFDEADALFGKRTEVKDSHDRYANIEIDYLLQRMEDHPGIAILATNRKGDLDPAFLRRLRFIIDLPFPDAILRRRIWVKVFPLQAPTNGLDLDSLARLELTGAGIKNVALHAAFLAAGEGGPIRMAHCLHAARREYAKLEKVPVGLPPLATHQGGRR